MFKKILTVALTIVLSILTLFAVSAEDKKEPQEMNEYDSRYVSKEVKGKLDLEGADNIIKIYNYPGLWLFVDCDNIGEVLKSKKFESAQVQYLLMSGDEILSRWATLNGETHKGNIDSAYGINAKALSVYQDEKFLNIISEDIEVKGMYYFSGQSSLQGTAIYYETNKGGYVYYNSLKGAVVDCLFPVKDFHEFAKAVQEEIIKNPPPPGSSIESTVWNLTQYDINSPEFNPNAGISEGNKQVSDNANALLATPQTRTTVNKGLLVGLITAGVVLVVGAIVTPVLLVKRRKGK